MKTTEWKEFTEDGHRYRIRAEYGWHQTGQQEPYWSVTAEQERHERGKWREDSGGTMHDAIRGHFPFLAPTLKWHLSFQKSGPLHYEANARYWLEKHYGVSKWAAQPYDPDPLGAFKSTVVFGALPEDQGVPSLEQLTAWCAARLPRLLEAMHQDTGAV